MNGLKFIRKQCNLSASELADILGITRQALSSWENGKKEIPEKRLRELTEYFGLESKYFGEITTEDVEYLQGKGMFRDDINGKEAYRYIPNDEYEKYKRIGIYYWGDREISLDKELILAQKRKQETLDKISDIIKWVDSPYRIDQINLTYRNCNIYGMINDLMELLRETKKPLKVPFLYELINVWKAMLLAYGLIDESGIGDRECREYCGEDKEWIIQLSKILKEHWDDEADFHNEFFLKKRENIS